MVYCAEAGSSSRPTSGFTSQLSYGYTVGATEATNAERVAAADQARQEVYARLCRDRLGLTNHRGLSAWSHSHIPAIRQAVETGDPYQLRVWVDFSGNKLAMLASSPAWYTAAMEHLDYVVGQQPIFTSYHIELCDMFFPTEEWLEHPRSRSGQLNYTFAAPAVVHLGESINPMHMWGVLNDRISERLNEHLDEVVFTGTGQTVEELGIDFPLFTLAGRGGSSDDTYWASEISSMASTVGLDPTTATVEEYKEAVKNRSDAYYVSTASEVYWSYGQHLVEASDGLPVGFGTESRKCEVYCTLLIKLGRTGWPYNYPQEFEEPVDSRVATYDGDYSPIARVPLQNEAHEVENSEGYIMPYDEDFPLAITSGRVPFFHHGTMRHAAYSREMYPAPYVSINPETAEEYGISDGDWVEISSRRTQGEEYDTSNPGTERSYNGIKEQNTKVGDPIHTIANVTQAVAPKVLWMERFWNPECFDSTQDSKTGGWQESSINVITNGIDAQFNEVYGSYNYRAFAVNIKKSERPDRVWVEPKEFEPFMPSTTNEMNPELGVLIDNVEVCQAAYVDLPEGQCNNA